MKLYAISYYFLDSKNARYHGPGTIWANSKDEAIRLALNEILKEYPPPEYRNHSVQAQLVGQ
jgi:hypothetical protein